MNGDVGREYREVSHTGRCWAFVAGAVSRGLADLRSMISKKPLEQRLEALRAAGCLTSFAELEASVKLPEGTQNAAARFDASRVRPAVGEGIVQIFFPIRAHSRTIQAVL